MPLKTAKRLFGEHLTPKEVFETYIYPEIKNCLYEHIWVDLFAGEGNLILPILEHLKESERVSFFKERIFLFDIQQRLVEEAIKKAVRYGIPEELARQNIRVQDTIKNYPSWLLKKESPVYHITNPPYLYVGYMPKQESTRRLLEYFVGEKEGYQDLYQLALINDLKEAYPCRA
jgi:23S rRNA G2445 N2-methylase RlmL